MVNPFFMFLFKGIVSRNEYFCWGSKNRNRSFWLSVEGLHSFLLSRLQYRGVTYYCRAGLFGSQCDMSMQISPWAVRTVVPRFPVGENGSIPLLTLTLTTITSMQLLNKQASRPLHVDTTMQPPSKNTVHRCTRLNTNLWNKKEWHWTPSIYNFLPSFCDENHK